MLSVAPALDKSLLLSRDALFQTAPPAASYYGEFQVPSGDATGVFCGDSQTQTAVFHFTFDGTARVKQADGGAVVSLDGESTWLATGDPVVPVRQSMVLIPYGMEIASIEASYLDEGIVIAGGVELLAAPAAVPLDEGLDAFGKETLPFSLRENWDSPQLLSEPLDDGLDAFDGGISVVSTSFGAQDAADYANHTIAGYNVGALSVFPVEYDAPTGTLIYHSAVSVTVTTEAAGGDGTVALRDSPSDRMRVAELVDNPEALASYPTPGDPGEPGGDPSPLPAPSNASLPTEGPYEYVIVTSSALEDSFQTLVDQKRSRGLSACTVTTEYIDANYAGTETGDLADKIREFIGDAYVDWNTQWVLLGGDREVVPKRGVYANVGATVDNSLPTDMYYACLDGPWNGDGDALWGESTDGNGGGDVDLLPEVYVGRAPASNVTEAGHFVSKTIRYETTAHANASTAVWLAEKMDSRTWGSYSAIPIRDRCIPRDWDLVERYDSSGGWTGTDLLSDLNAGPHLVNHLGHASATYNARLGNTNVTALTNEDPYFMYSQGCNSGSFDTHDLAIGEQHVVHQYGALGVVMNSRYGWYLPGNTPGASHFYAREFWDALFNEGRTHLGEVNQDSKDDNLFRVGGTGLYRWIQFETNLFGDPETPFQLWQAVGNGEIQGTVWEDVNGDGQKQAEEQTLSGQTVFLDVNDNGAPDEGALTAAASNVPVDIPEQGMVTSELVVGANVPITDVNVTLDISHTYDADLEVFLISPSGTKVMLFANVGGWEDNFTNTTLDDEAAVSITDGAAPFTGTFRPEGLLSRFDGENPNGTWTLQITDAMAWDSGVLNSWSITVTYAEPTSETDASGSYRLVGLAPGQHIVRQVLQPGWIQTTPAAGFHEVTLTYGQIVLDRDFGILANPGWLVDNSFGSPGYTDQAGWLTSAWHLPGRQGPFGNDCRYHYGGGDGSGIARWELTDLPSGYYEVLTTWTSASGRASNAPYEVYDGVVSGANLRLAVDVDQRRDPNEVMAEARMWELLGVCRVDSGTLTVQLHDGEDSDGNPVDGKIVADAVRLTKLPDIPQYVMDNRYPGYDEAAGGWVTGTWRLPGDPEPYRGNYRICRPGPGSDTARWTLTGLTPGHYEVFVTWTPATGRASNAPYRVYAGTELQLAKDANQRLKPNDASFDGYTWERLGTVYMGSGGLTVELGHDKDSQGVDVDGKVVADAIWAKRLPDPPEGVLDNQYPCYHDTGEANGWSTGTWHLTGRQGPYLENYRIHPGGGTGSNAATWTLTGLEDGDYEVFATWTSASGRASNAHYEVYDGGPEVGFFLLGASVDQRVEADDMIFDGHAWELLGTCEVTTGTLTVLLSDEADGKVVADAIWVYGEPWIPDPPPPAIEMSSTGSVVAPAETDRQPIASGRETAWGRSRFSRGEHGTVLLGDAGAVARPVLGAPALAGRASLDRATELGGRQETAGSAAADLRGRALRGVACNAVALHWRAAEQGNGIQHATARGKRLDVLPLDWVRYTIHPEALDQIDLPTVASRESAGLAGLDEVGWPGGRVTSDELGKSVRRVAEESEIELLFASDELLSATLQDDFETRPTEAA